jgi:hypothetical protein
MRFWVWVSAVLFASSAAPACAETMPKDPAALDIADVFSHTCLHNGGQPGRVAAWAKQQRLPELGATDARKALFADGADGRVWVIRGPVTNMYLAVRRGAGTCALFGERADAADFGLIYDEYLQFLSPAGSRVDREPDKVQQGQFGTQTQRFAIIHAPGGKVTYFVMSADERAGGPYQVSLMIATKGLGGAGLH